MRGVDLELGPDPIICKKSHKKSHAPRTYMRTYAKSHTHRDAKSHTHYVQKVTHRAHIHMRKVTCTAFARIGGFIQFQMCEKSSTKYLCIFSFVLFSFAHLTIVYVELRDVVNDVVHGKRVVACA